MKIIVKNKDGVIEKEFISNGEKLLLSELRDQDIEIHSACNNGMCGACMCHIENNEEYIIKNKKTEPAFPLGKNEVMTCIAGVKQGENGEVILKKMY